MLFLVTSGLLYADTVPLTTCRVEEIADVVARVLEYILLLESVTELASPVAQALHELAS